MTIKQILMDYPDISKEIQEFFKEVLLTSVKKNKNVPPSFAEAISHSGVTQKMIENYLMATPRLICDFMDERDIIILIDYHENIGFSFTINGEPSNVQYNNRKDAENQAVIESIILYKELLIKKNQ